LTKTRFGKEALGNIGNAKMLRDKYSGGSENILTHCPSKEVEVMSLSACQILDCFPLFFAGCIAGFKFVTSSFCDRCPSDTYQDKQGQTSCKNCPGNEQTFGKTAMTSKSDCSGI